MREINEIQADVDFSISHYFLMFFPYVLVHQMNVYTYVHDVICNESFNVIGPRTERISSRTCYIRNKLRFIVGVGVSIIHNYGNDPRLIKK